MGRVLVVEPWAWCVGSTSSSWNATRNLILPRSCGSTTSMACGSFVLSATMTAMVPACQSRDPSSHVLGFLTRPHSGDMTSCLMLSPRCVMAGYPRPCIKCINRCKCSVHHPHFTPSMPQPLTSLVLPLQAGIRVTLTMTNHWPEYGGFAWYTRQVLGGGAAPELFYSNGRVVGAFQNWVRRPAIATQSAWRSSRSRMPFTHPPSSHCPNHITPYTLYPATWGPMVCVVMHPPF